MRFELVIPLRCFAALLVFAYHLDFSPSFQATFPALNTLIRSALGVPIFFVISGFCITATARKSLRMNESAWHFLLRRYERIFPTYWLAILVIICIPFAVEFISSMKTGQYIPPSSANPSYGYLRYSSSDWLRVTTLTQIFTPIPEASTLQYKFATFNACLWSVAIEVQFYVVSAIAVLFQRRFYAIILAVTLISLPTCMNPQFLSSGFFLPYWPMYALGCFVYWLFENDYTLTRLFAGWTVPVSVGLTLLSLGVFATLMPFDAHDCRIGVAAFVAWIMFVGHALDRYVVMCKTSTYRSVQWLWLGISGVSAMSYSLYLLHARVRFLADQFVNQFLPDNSIASDVGMCLCTFGLCYLFYRMCEKPLTKMMSLGQRFQVPTLTLPDLPALRQQSEAGSRSQLGPA